MLLPMDSISARSGFAFACQHVSYSALSLVTDCPLVGERLTLGLCLMQVGLICELRPCCWNELVECWLLEFAFGEGLRAGFRQRSGLDFWHEGDRAPTEAGAGETGPSGTVLLRCFYEGIQLGGRDLEVVAQGGVRSVHQASELVEVGVSESLDCLEDAGVLGDDVPGAHQLCSGEEIQVPLGGVAQFFDTERLRRALARRPPVVVAGVGEAALDAGIANDQSKASGLEVERNALCFQSTAVD